MKLGRGGAGLGWEKNSLRFANALVMLNARQRRAAFGDRNPMTAPDSFHHLKGNRVRWRGRTLLYFGGCDYFRLSQHPSVRKAAAGGLRRFGLNVAASRLTTGQHALYDRLEARLASFFEAEAALLVSTGYLTSSVVAQAWKGMFTHVFLDELAHPALQDAALQVGCRVTTFRHLDPVDLKRRVHRLGRQARVLVLTDGVFPLDGAVAPLQTYIQSLPSSGMLLVDDAHGAGVLGENGQGTLEYEGVGRDRVVQCVTLSKAFGVFGGAVMGSRELRERLFAHSRAFIGSTPIPLPMAAAALQSVNLLQRGNAKRTRMRRNADYVRSMLREQGFPVQGSPTPIIPLALAGRGPIQRLQRALLRAGIHPPFVQYAGAPEGVFRFVISSEHTPAELDQLIGALTRFKVAGRSVGGKENGRTR